MYLNTDIEQETIFKCRQNVQTLIAVILTIAALAGSVMLIRHIMYTYIYTYYGITENFDKQAFHYQCDQMSSTEAEAFISKLRGCRFTRCPKRIGHKQNLPIKIRAYGRDHHLLYEASFPGDGIVMIKIWNVADQYTYKVTDF